MSINEQKECLFSQLSDEVKQLNEMLLSVSWKETDFVGCFFENSQEIICPGLSAEQNDLIRNIVNCIPEWKRLIGCKQHYIHDYCLDFHTISVLKYVQKHEDFDKLRNYDKLLILYSALLHDIAKNENEIDPEHPIKGAKKSSSILYRLGFGEDFINSVYLLVKYHQVLGFMVSGKINLTSDEIIEMFKKPILLDLQMILSLADIKSVKKDESFCKDGLNEKLGELMKKIKNLINSK